MDYLARESLIKRSFVVAKLKKYKEIPSGTRSYALKSNIMIKDFSYEKTKVLNS